MRRWLPRALWLLAWCCWAWLGWGLYRELPRELGPMVCRLASDEGEQIEGFSAGEDVIVSLKGHGTDDAAAYFRNPRDGTVVRVFPLGSALRLLGGHFVSVKHGLLMTGAPGPRAQVLDFRTGAAAPATAVLDGWAGMHPSRPWLLTYEFSRYCRVHADRDRASASQVWADPNAGDEVRVVDLRTGRTTFHWKHHGLEDSLRTRCGPPFFSADGTLIVIPTGTNADKARGGSRLALEVYRVDDPATPVATLPGVANGRWCTSLKGQVVVSRFGEGVGDGCFEVYDLRTGRREGRFHPPAGVGESPNSLRYDTVVLSPQGASVLHPSSGVLSRVADGAIIWRAPEGSRIADDCRADTFDVIETWPALIGKTLGIRGTQARRRLCDGSLVFRCRQEVPSDATRVNAARSLVLVNDLLIHQFPPMVNYPLLALCQSILALPLVFTWLALRWRRNRRLRMAGAAP